MRQKQNKKEEKRQNHGIYKRMVVFPCECVDGKVSGSLNGPIGANEFLSHSHTVWSLSHTWICAKVS